MCKACGGRVAWAKARVPVNGCRPYGGQPTQVFWRKLEVLRWAGSLMDPISSQLCEPS